MDAVGLGPDYRSANDASLYTVEAHIRYLEEVSARTDLEVRSSIIGVTPKLLWIWHELWAAGRLRATEEVLGVHVRGRSSAPLPDDVVARARDAVVDGCEREADGRTIDDLVAERDRGVIAVLRALGRA